MNWRTIVRDLGIGRLAMLLWHRPAGRVRTSLANGGPLGERRTEKGRQEMERAATSLRPIATDTGAPVLSVHLMTGRRFWYQTVFCLHSLSGHSGGTVQADIYDDGTLDDTHRSALRSVCPSARFHSLTELRERLDTHLPETRFPILRERWLAYPNIRKLIDVHLGCSGWKLVIDSDLLFFRRPEALLSWNRDPRQPLVAVDCVESYGYSRALMGQLAGAPIPHDVNVGICGLASESIDWAELESWTRTLQERERTNYYLEQALVAMLVARGPFESVPRRDYLTKPGRQETLHPTAVMHHYVANSKRWYFRHAWRHVPPVFFPARA